MFLPLPLPLLLRLNGSRKCCENPSQISVFSSSWHFCFPFFSHTKEKEIRKGTGNSIISLFSDYSEVIRCSRSTFIFCFWCKKLEEKKVSISFFSVFNVINFCFLIGILASNLLGAIKTVQICSGHINCELLIKPFNMVFAHLLLYYHL